MGASLTDLWKATKNYLVIEMPSEEHNQRGQNKQKKPEAENFFLKLWISLNVAEQADPSSPAGEYFEDITQNQFVWNLDPAGKVPAISWGRGKMLWATAT